MAVSPTIKQLFVFVEENSAKAFVEKLMTNEFPTHAGFVKVIAFQGKADLDTKLGTRLKGLPPDFAAVIVLRDQDSADCMRVKQKLRGICDENGFPKAPVRIVCRELEAWYLGERDAFCAAFPKVDKNYHRQQNLRVPDDITNPKSVMYGMIKGPQRQIPIAKSMAEHFLPGRCQSRSFQVFWQSICDHMALGGH